MRLHGRDSSCGRSCQGETTLGQEDDDALQDVLQGFLPSDTYEDGLMAKQQQIKKPKKPRPQDEPDRRTPSGKPTVH